MPFQISSFNSFIVAIALALIAAPALLSQSSAVEVSKDGIVRVKSVYGFDDTVERLKADIEKKGIKFIMDVDRSKLGADAGIALKPSTLLIFGNPPLGIQFLTSNPHAGLDWPVRLLVTADEKSEVSAVYTDFAWIARRHNITDRDAAFKMASEVIASITSSVATKA